MMKIIKRMLLTEPLILAMGTASASVNYSLVVSLRNGDVHEYKAQEKPVVTFTETGVKVKSFNVNVEYSKEHFESFFFKAEDTVVPTGIEEIQDSQEEMNLEFIYLDPQTIQVSAISSDGILAYVYNLNGNALIAQPIIDGNAIISLSTLPAGVYILSVKNQSIKILKK